jgi:hypothetical protein
MTEPSARGTAGDDPTAAEHDDPAAGTGTPEDRFADLAERPVAEHVEVFEDEHARLQRRLGTIDQI